MQWLALACNCPSINLRAYGRWVAALMVGSSFLTDMQCRHAIIKPTAFLQYVTQTTVVDLA